MAKQVPAGDYKKIRLYSCASDQQKKKYDAWKMAESISSDHMYYLLRVLDWQNRSKEEKKKSNRSGEMMVIGGILWFLVAVNAGNRWFLLAASLYVLAAAVVYFTGSLDPAYLELKQIRKQLKAYRPVRSFEEYDNSQSRFHSEN